MGIQGLILLVALLAASSYLAERQGAISLAQVLRRCGYVIGGITLVWLVLRGGPLVALTVLLFLLPLIMRGWSLLGAARRHFNNTSRHHHHESHSQTPSSSHMTAAEAYAILGLSPHATPAEIKVAHRRLIARLHPDQGGSNYLASQINRARQVLLGE